MWYLIGLQLGFESGLHLGLDIELWGGMSLGLGLVLWYLHPEDGVGSDKAVEGEHGSLDAHVVDVVGLEDRDRAHANVCHHLIGDI